MLSAFEQKTTMGERMLRRSRREPSAAEISAVLKDLFGVVVPDEPVFAAKLARLDWPDFSAS